MTDQPTSPDPYSKQPSDPPPPPGPYGDPAPPPYGAPPPPPPTYGAPPPPPAYGAPPPPAYGSPPAPAYGAPPAYGTPPVPLTPESQSARNAGIVWTIVNGVSILFCGNLLGIVGLVFGILGITKARDDLAAARRNVRLSWIFFLISVVLAVVGWIAIFAVYGAALFSSSSSSSF